jgi:(acyl-carrier-protein) S-malonyltransferase
MSKIAFMFPGQGSFEAGMGRDVAEAIPEAMAVFDEAAPRRAST